LLETLRVGRRQKRGFRRLPWRVSARTGARVSICGGTTLNAVVEVRDGWLASLDLEFALRGTRTVLARRSHVGPLVVQRPFYPEGEVCHVYLVHPPGGVVGGDALELRARVRDGAHALVTTPAATRFYRSESRVARQVQDIALDAATFEWLPQETILFPDARAKIATRVRLSERSKFIGWEIVCYGRPASGLKYCGGSAHQDFELWLNDVPLVLDHLRLHGASETMHARFGLAGHTALGTMFAYPADDALLEAARAVSVDSASRGSSAEGDASSGEVASIGDDASLDDEPARYAAAGEVRSAFPSAVDAPGRQARPAHLACTKVDGVLVCRAIGPQADAVRAALAAIWSAIRPQITGRAAVAPRIWST
jgi:urease accessory protein